MKYTTIFLQVLGINKVYCCPGSYTGFVLEILQLSFPFKHQDEVKQRRNMLV